MPRVGIASVSQSAADAGARAADEGGNAVDAAVAAALVSVITHPAMCSLGGIGFLTIWPPGAPPVTVDGAAEMPGRNLPAERFGRGLREVYLEYGGGVRTRVGPGSVATPGALAACDLAVRRWGALPWGTLLEPAYEHAVRGFPLPLASHRYLTYAHERIYGLDPRSHAALHTAAGQLRKPGEKVRIPHLPESLRRLADGGVEELYGGELGRRVCEHVEAEGGLLTREDLAAYEARVRPALEVDLDEWRLATNPPPAIGGVTLAAMILLMNGAPSEPWTRDAVGRLIGVERAVFEYRRRHLDRSEQREEEAHRLLEAAAAGLPLTRDLPSGEGRPRGSELLPCGGAHRPPDDGGEAPPRGPGSTLHTSAVDTDGLACSVTLSDGYGSGVMAPGTGFWLNNCLGEPELNRRGVHAWTPGARLPSNMAPSVARGPRGEILAIGSPGADRITTAILATLLNFVRLEMSLQEAVAHPRLHVALREEGEGYEVVHEAGIPVPETSAPVRCLDEPSMYFGGVEAALKTSGGSLDLAADARRSGGTAVGGRP
ncbi:MAG: gamma-glutamyltransferase [Gemmatimonadota bacterium]